MSPVIDKQQFENRSGGWVGAVVIGPKGDETGVAVEPGGTVWLSEPEQILTANAPRRPEDNPFLEQELRRIDPDTGEWVTDKVTPLVPIQRDRFIPANDRPIPSDLATAAAEAGHAQVAATGDHPESFSTPDRVAEREAAVLASEGTAKPHQPVAPPRATAAAQAAEEEAPTPQSDEAEPPTVTEPSASEEETAAESTGAAPAPTGTPPTGEFQAAEEVGTPDAANAGTEVAPETGGSTAGNPDTDTGTGRPPGEPTAEEQEPRPPAQQPAPWTPQNNI